MADSGGLPRTGSPQEGKPNGLHLEPQEPSPTSTWLYAPQDQKPHLPESPTIGLLLLSGSSPYILPAA